MGPSASAESSCPADFLGLRPIDATITGPKQNVVKVTLKLLNLSLIGQCDVTVDGAPGHVGTLFVDFTLL